MVRLKFRYIIGQLLDEQALSTQISEADLQATMREKISQLFGDCGLGLFGSITHVKFFDSDRLIFIIRAPRESFTDVHFALTSICDIKKKPVVARVLSVCSCNRTCREKIAQLYSKYIELDNNLSLSQKEQHHATISNRLSSVDL